MPVAESRSATIASVNQRGFGLIEILIVVAVLAFTGYVLMQYVGSSAKTVEQLQRDRPLERARLAADRATLTSLEGLVRSYQAEKGQWPPDKATVIGLLMAPPKFQCAGNDLEYDPVSGVLGLTITDDARC